MVLAYPVHFHRADVARDVQVCMTELLAQLVEEVGPIPTDIVEIILEQFEKVYWFGV